MLDEVAHEEAKLLMQVQNAYHGSDNQKLISFRDPTHNQKDSSDISMSKEGHDAQSSAVNSSIDSQHMMSEDEKILAEAKKFENYLKAMSNAIPKYVEDKNTRKLISLVDTNSN